MAYSYSVFSNWNQIARACHPIHVVNTDGDGRAASWSASGIALLGIKRPEWSAATTRLWRTRARGAPQRPGALAA